MLHAQLPKRKRIGVIGCGQWGPNQVRVFFVHPEAQVVRICDTDESRLKAVQSLYPGIEITRDWRQVTEADDIDAVVIATPVVTHFEITQSALKAGKDVLCEKPLTKDLKSSRELHELALKLNRILMVGHIFLFNAGIRKLKELMDTRVCGKTYYLHAKRTNLGPVRHDVNAVHDLASHDISIFNYLLGAKPRVVSAVGKCVLRPHIEDVAYVSLEYPDHVFAHIHVSWLDPKKMRQITVVGSEKMITWDDLAERGPIEIFSKKVEQSHYYNTFGEFQLIVKEGEVVIPHVKVAEPLKAQADHFMECIRDRKKPLCDGLAGCDVMETLDEIERLLAAERARS